MMTVRLIVLGKLKEEYLRQACGEYQKRLQSFCRLQIVELTPYRLPDNPSASQIEDALQREADEILKQIPPSAKVFSLCIEGKMLSSEQFSAELEKTAVSGTGCAVFIIGSSFGLSDSIKRQSHMRLSMSPMTFPHQLARVMLLEQLYRAFQISHGGKYHK
ncbi:MAG: 23S rRNA (pseudouridine(1915)-N(3))-methyltransferase RlmH [Oscillospiraceae bacterium]|nr:23S rRNA (pseudouridine(1915)-N(3))-methyltransferase RlmH [Oscillospiraceae bacterium]